MSKTTDLSSIHNGNDCTSHFELWPFPALNYGQYSGQLWRLIALYQCANHKNNSWWIIECHVRCHGSNPLGWLLYVTFRDRLYQHTAGLPITATDRYLEFDTHTPSINGETLLDKVPYNQNKKTVLYRGIWKKQKCGTSRQRIPTTFHWKVHPQNKSFHFKPIEDHAD